MYRLPPRNLITMFRKKQNKFLIIEITHNLTFFLRQNQLRMPREHFFPLHFLNYNVECTKRDLKGSIFNRRDFVVAE